MFDFGDACGGGCIGLVVSTSCAANCSRNLVIS
jgi:hypothetical protein